MWERIAIVGVIALCVAFVLGVGTWLLMEAIDANSDEGQSDDYD
jgi:hypothetical protein